VFSKGSLLLGRLFWKRGDVGLIDGVAVNGSAQLVGWVSGALRQIQSGRMYHYAFAMILGLIALLGSLIWTLRA